MTLVTYSNPSEGGDVEKNLQMMAPGVRPHVLSYGAGYDSSYLLIRYCQMTDEERGFPLSSLIVVHAVVGGEGAETKRLVEEAIFPLCREHNIWTVQVCRNGESQLDGITVLSSTRQPTTLHTRGPYSLFPYSIMSASVPQRGGSSRLCTLKFKAWVIDALIQHLLKDSPRSRFIGYNADEHRRAFREDSMWNIGTVPFYEVGYNADERSRLKDKSWGDQPYDYEIGFNADESGRIKESDSRLQVFRFPLIEMGIGRQECEEGVDQFAATRTGGHLTQGHKSYCHNICIFGECNGKRKSGNNTTTDLRDDWLREPIYGGDGLPRR